MFRMGDILELYKSIGTNQDVGTSMTPVKRTLTLDYEATREEFMAKQRKEAIESSNIDNNHFSAVIKKFLPQNPPVSLMRSTNDTLPENFLKRKREKCNKGLRHFSMKVCEKVKQKGITTYNEVADELVQEYCSYSNDHVSMDYWSYDQKNVRRRVYDALNVLMAMKIISKEKKEIKWIGLPCNKKQECDELELEKQKKLSSIKLKCDRLKDLIDEHVAHKSLINRNKRTEEAINEKNFSIKIPFLVVDTDKKTTIDCSISNNREEYLFNFDNTFKLNSHIYVLKTIGLAISSDAATSTNYSNQNYSALVPKLFHSYIKQMLASSNDLQPQCVMPNLPNFKDMLKKDNLTPNNSKEANINDNGSIENDEMDDSAESNQSDSENENNSFEDSSS